MLAMYVVLESYLGLVCDFPEAYEGQPGFEFIRKVPTVWDKTKVLDAEISGFITIAREKDSEWFVGSITDAPRDQNISFSFLPEGTYSADIYSDVPDNLNGVNIENKEVTAGSNTKVRLEKGGGMVIRVRKK